MKTSIQRSMRIFRFSSSPMASFMRSPPRQWPSGIAMSLLIWLDPPLWSMRRSARSSSAAWAEKTSAMTNSPDRHVLTGEQAKGNPSGDEFVELERAHKEALNVVQWLARMACSYVTSGDPERRVDLDYRAAEAALTTKTFAEGMALEMRFPELHLQFLHNGIPAPIPSAVSISITALQRRLLPPRPLPKAWRSKCAFPNCICNFCTTANQRRMFSILRNAHRPKRKPGSWSNSCIAGSTGKNSPRNYRIRSPIC